MFARHLIKGHHVLNMYTRTGFSFNSAAAGTSAPAPAGSAPAFSLTGGASSAAAGAAASAPATAGFSFALGGGSAAGSASAASAPTLSFGSAPAAGEAATPFSTFSFPPLPRQSAPVSDRIECHCVRDFWLYQCVLLIIGMVGHEEPLLSSQRLVSCS